MYGDTSTIKVSFQIGIPSSSGGNSNSSSGDNSSNDTIITVEEKTLDAAINLANRDISKNIDLSHCEAIIISEELAKKGISNYIYTLQNDIQIRPNTYLVISKQDSKSILENSKPVFESLTSKYYRIIPTTVENTGYTDAVTLKDFYSGLNDYFRQSYAILGRINKGVGTKQNISTNSASTNSFSSTNSNEKDKTKGDDIEMIGLAVFNGDTLVGELNEEECICHLILTNNLENCVITFPNPLDLYSNIDLKVELDKNTKNKVNIINTSPYVTSKINVKARILSISNNSDYLNNDNIKIIEKYLNLYLEDQITKYLYKTSKEFHSDIVGFGRYAIKNFSSLEDWNNYNWLDNYKNSFFKVKVESKVKSTYLLLDS